MRRELAGLLVALTALIATSGVSTAGHLFASAMPEPPPIQTPTPASTSASRALVDTYCITCHNQRSKTAGLMLDAANLDQVSEDAETWEKVIRKLRGRMMPPPGAPRPDEASIDTFVTQLESSIDRAAASHANPGHVMLHRLNRTEYGRAIRDLLDLTDTDVASLLPSDDDSDGFDNVASVLKESPAFMEGYIGAARETARLAVGDMSSPVAFNVYRVPGGRPQREYVEGMPLGTRGGWMVRHYFPLDGEYKFDITLRQSQIYVKGLEFPHQLIMTIDGERVFQRAIGGEDDLRAQDQELAAAAQAIQGRLKNLRFRVKAGPHTVIVTFLQKTFAQSDEVLQPYTRDVGPSGGMNGVPSVEKLEVMGPYNPSGPGDTPSRRRIFVCRPRGVKGPAGVNDDELACATKILSTLATRAYRRPVTDADIETPLRFYKVGRSKGDFDKGIQQGLTYILASPKFLYRSEQDPPNLTAGSNHAITDLELASRLSFFLWSSIPDTDLLRLAREGRLKDPGVLDRQVRRMLTDPRSDALVTNFFAQWLRLRELALVDPDTSEYPNFEDDLRQAFQRELELFTASIVREDRSVLELMTANDTFVNERLALHYGIPGVRGAQFRRVTLTDPNRFGLLGKGGILTLTSYGNRTSPVLRGRYVLETILGTPPPTPPPNVPPLKENQAGTAQLSVRQLLEQHRANTTCASCHRVLDPPGLALENFDAIGQWRTKDSGVPVDASTTMLDGTIVSNPAALRQVLLKRPEQFLGTMTEKLLTYALGRSVAYYDMPAVRGIVRESARANYTFSSMILAIVKSTPFQMRRVPGEGL
jgi:mono/diheme cytochrome c family protein